MRGEGGRRPGEGMCPLPSALLWAELARPFEPQMHLPVILSGFAMLTVNSAKNLQWVFRPFVEFTLSAANGLRVTKRNHSQTSGRDGLVPTCPDAVRRDRVYRDALSAYFFSDGASFICWPQQISEWA